MHLHISSLYNFSRARCGTDVLVLRRKFGRKERRGNFSRGRRINETMDASQEA